DAASAQMTITWLSDEHYIVEWVDTGDKALDLLAVETFDVLLLDWDVPGVSGFEILRRLRSKGDMTPVIMLTGKSTPRDKEVGLDSGADDYMAKPYDLTELCARIRVQLRKNAHAPSNVLKARDLTLDPQEFKVMLNGK